MSAALLSPETLVSDPHYPRLKEYLVESTGLGYYAGKDVDLACRVGRRLSITGAGACGAYLEILRDPLRGPSEMDALIAEVTIGETYFFRHQEHFDALRGLVLPALIANNRTTRRLRIWCAGCADGPEPYSLAILLQRGFAADLKEWEVTILGTDINRQGLARARDGKFEEWAFRSTPEDLKRNCFRQEGRQWSILPEYKARVSFQYHNLAEPSLPPPGNGGFPFDLIVCRNVTIYFAADLMQATIRRFHDCLAPGGWLLVGPSEPNMTHFLQFQAVNAPGVTLYQKPAPTPSKPLVSQSVLAAGSLQPAPPPVEIPAPDNPEGGTARSAPNANQSPLPPTLADAMLHGGRGAWESASECCDRLLEADNLNSMVHFYQALVLARMQRQNEAESALRRAIYLDRQSVLAHYYLGLALQSKGDSPRAARSFENALELLRARCDADIFAEAGGITAGELKSRAHMHLEILRERQ